MTVLFLLSLILLLIFLNGIFSMAEIAIITSRKTKLLAMAHKGNYGAKMALRMRDNPGNLLSTVQIGITLIGLIAGILSGAQLAEKAGVMLDSFYYIHPNGTAVAYALIVLGITYLSIVIGELVPKRIALSNPEKFAAFSAKLMFVVSVCFRPLVSVLDRSSKVVLALLNVDVSRHRIISEEEVLLLLERATRSGSVREEEKSMVERIFVLGDKKAKDVMTPRSKIIWFDTSRDYAQNWMNMKGNDEHEYFLVCDKKLDNLLGVASTKDLWFQSVRGHTTELTETLKKPLFLDHETPALKIAQTLKKPGKHIAVVRGNGRKIVGVLTLDDIIDAIIGEIRDVSEVQHIQKHIHPPSQNSKK